MRQSKLFTTTRRNAPKGEVVRNAELLIRGGFIHKEMAGVYSYLPLGLRTLSKIEQIIREEMDAVGGQEVRMATLHPSENWKKTGGWSSVDVLFKIQSRTEKEYALGSSEEEIVTPIAKEYIGSYKDLPLAVYQIEQKYRDELRAKSGIMRGREFGMKDMYSFHADQKDFERFYETVKDAYFKIFERCGLDAKVTEASGGAFSEKLSYEFMVLTDAGEDDILYCGECTHCANVEVAKSAAGDACPKCGKGKLTKARAAEVGNVFDLGQRYPKSFGFTYKDKDGNEQTPVMGCYGIGTTRLMGTIVEVLSDEKGMIWPATVAPFPVHLVAIAGGNADITEEADRIYELLSENGIYALYDDRDERAGAKFADADLIGIPKRLVVSEKTVSAGGIEITDRSSGSSTLVSDSAIVEHLRM
ncbi:MAG: aminoacyl--tRNA ligase-related protein [Patescibacteria group bacterium]|nr:aminoacyl--tRNA ligase-related protein [bacterium]MDZ4226997.1 aminoacyl--tRNA ligase-related protein [Patescibacteria group bacterium]